ncbi:MAG: Wzz/FepE/Etk N-terminal domain-containing protein [Lachnospiraceae bacterium]|nr:Wzz/FepE/Etk N-terminal domain-containing protein [Lachnospiraceae bacterium]
MENLQTQSQPIRLQNEDDVIDLKEVFFMLLHNWKKIFLAMLAGAVIFGAYHTFLMRPSYRADAVIYITNTDSMITFSDLQLSAALTDDYAKIIKSRTVLKRVIEELQLDLDYKQLGNLISVSNPDSTHIIEISVTCDDLELSRNIANALLNISVKQIYQIIGSSEPTVIDYSEADAVENVTPRLLKYLVMGAMIGAVLVCAVLLVAMLMNTTLKTEDDVMKYLDIPVLTSVPYYREH